jgi:hypothetical protein
MVYSTNVKDKNPPKTSKEALKKEIGVAVIPEYKAQHPTSKNIEIGMLIWVLLSLSITGLLNICAEPLLSGLSNLPIFFILH